MCTCKVQTHTFLQSWAKLQIFNTFWFSEGAAIRPVLLNYTQGLKKERGENVVTVWDWIKTCTFFMSCFLPQNVTWLYVRFLTSRMEAMGRFPSSGADMKLTKTKDKRIPAYSSAQLILRQSLLTGKWVFREVTAKPISGQVWILTPGVTTEDMDTPLGTRGVKSRELPEDFLFPSGQCRVWTSPARPQAGWGRGSHAA